MCDDVDLFSREPSSLTMCAPLASRGYPKMVFDTTYPPALQCLRTTCRRNGCRRADKTIAPRRKSLLTREGMSMMCKCAWTLAVVLGFVVTSAQAQSDVIKLRLEKMPEFTL